LLSRFAFTTVKTTRGIHHVLERIGFGSDGGTWWRCGFDHCDQG
jgi:hypothetical protein